MTHRLSVPWPDPAPFRGRDNRPIRLLAVSDESDPTLESEATRESLAPIDLVVGCGDLEPAYLNFVADAFHVPLAYVRGNHDIGGAWRAAHDSLPDAMADARIHEEDGLRLLPFSGSPRYAPHGHPDVEQQVSSWTMWRKVLAAWPAAMVRRPLLVVTHAAPRGLNDAADAAHRGFTSFRWLLDQVRPPLWLHGHTALVRRGMDDRCIRHGETLLINVTGAMLIELLPPATV